MLSVCSSLRKWEQFSDRQGTCELSEQSEGEEDEHYRELLTISDAEKLGKGPPISKLKRSTEINSDQKYFNGHKNGIEKFRKIYTEYYTINL